MELSMACELGGVASGSEAETGEVVSLWQWELAKRWERETERFRVGVREKNEFILGMGEKT